MKRINPFERDNPYLLLTSVYPFIIGHTAEAFQKARTILKISCLLHNEITLPGSLAIENIFIRDLLLQNEEFLKNGNLILDLRSSCKSFSDLMSEKNIENPYIAIAANHFDSICKSTISFDASNTTNQFKTDLIGYLRHFISVSRKNEVKEKLQLSLKTIEDWPSFLTLENAKTALSGTYLTTKLHNIATMLYCKAGAEVTNSQPLLTENIWLSSLVNSSTPCKINENHSLRYLADSAVMEFFAIRNDAIDKLSAEEIIEIRSEPLTLSYIKELDSSIEESKKIYESNGIINANIAREAKKISEIIIGRIYQKCSREKKSNSRENKVIHLIEEAGGVVVPGISTAKKGLTSLSRTMAKKFNLPLLEYTTTPISTYVSRFQNKIIG